MSRASADILDAIHGLLAGALLSELEAALAASRRPEKWVEGKLVSGPEPIPPQLFDKVMKFLKDNGIDAPRSNKPVDDLAAALTELDLDEEAMRISH